MNSPKKPNVLWISFEDCNPFYGCYGDPVARTPHLDRLAAEGCRWTNAFSTAGVCAPARSAIITGMYPISIGTHHMRTTHTNEFCPDLPTPYEAVVPHYVKCFPEYLRAEGYYCTNNAKTDYQFESPRTAWDELGEQAHWRNRPDPDQPFFAVFNPLQTHESGMWSENGPGSAMWPETFPEIAFDPAEMKVPPCFPDTPKVREALARMYTNIEANDAILGTLLKQLAEDGLEPGNVSDRLVSTVDLGPTVLSITGVPIPRHMQGRAFLGDQASSERSYVYASRDRYDESYDMVRAVRNKRFKYIRNYRPELPYLLWIPYRNRHPIVQEMWRAYLAGELAGPQLLMFRKKRPVEELYDTCADPYETNNLATSGDYRADLERLRDALDSWIRGVGDMGEIPESEMVRRWHPDGVQPETAPPLFIPICDKNPGTTPAPEGGTFPAPLAVQLYCSTQGASIAYTFDTGDETPWRLYTGPLSLGRGTTTLRARAIRIGYKESAETHATFRVTS